MPGSGASVRYEVKEGGVALVTLEHAPVNAVSLGLRTGITDALARANGDAKVRAVVLTGGDRVFSAGADISEFSTLPKPPQLPAVCDTVEASAKPVVAAINGLAFGGGLELALSCHYRVAAAGARVGLPEVSLGILPGAGGTQRLPRLAGVKTALHMITTGAPLAAPLAHKAGILDEVVAGSAAEVQAGALALARRVAAAPVAPRRTSGRAISESAAEVAALVRAAKEAAAKRARGFEAPQLCAEAVGAAALPFAQGMRVEWATMARLIRSRQAQAQQYLFFAEREAAHVKLAAAPLPIRSVGVIGAGTMGGGIAMCFLDAGIPVVMLEVKQDFLDRGLAVIRKNYASAVKRGRASAGAVEKRLGMLRGTLDYADLGGVDMVVEAVFENMEIKHKVFRQLDQHCKPQALLCSNTSTLSIDRIAEAVRDKGRVVGCHYFSPAHLMKLKEVVRGAHSSEAAVATAMALAKRIKKVGVLVGNCDGFVGNRMLEWYSREAVFCVEEGALPHEVDAVMFEFGMPMGPFAMGDLAGNDVGYKIREGLGLTGAGAGRGSSRYCTIADQLVEMGRLGQKTSKGWYDYAPGSRKGTPSAEVQALVEAHCRKHGITRRRVGKQEIRERCLFALINEGFRILEEGIAKRPGDIDVIYSYGYSWPRFEGGPMFYADTVGVAHVRDTMLHYAAKFPNVPWWTPCNLLNQVAASGKPLAKFWAERSGEQSAAARASYADINVVGPAATAAAASKL